MKKTFLYGLLLFSFSLTAQHKICAFDEIQQKEEVQNPLFKRARGDFQALSQKFNLKKLIENKAASLVNGVYEIPIVVHVIHPTGAAVGSTYNRSDAQIQAWIDRANQMFAGTYAYPSPPSDIGTSAVIPVRLVLAKRSPACVTTTGIVRYDGGSLTGYNTYGVRQQTANGATTTQVKSIAPHWPEDTYFNIYVVSMFDGVPNYGLMGWAGLPANSNTSFESFMKSQVVTLANDTTLAHELGHTMGLLHTFGSANSNGGACPTQSAPPNCSTDDDQVCDTERGESLLNVFPAPSNADLNVCTGANYQGVQYNMMNYTNSSALKFTQGQSDKTQTLFMWLRSSLTTSLGATVLPTTTVGTPIAATCNPPGVTNAGNYLVGPVSVKVGTIDNFSAGAWSGAPAYYVDYTLKACSMNVHTQLLVNQSQNIQIKIFDNDQSIRAWIDYNNNGSFDASELIASGNSVVTDPVTGYATLSANFTPPATAVLNTPLRMRVLADYVDPATITPCGQLNYGQVEDYAVTIVTALGTNDVNVDNDDMVIYPNPVTSGDKVFIKAKNGKNLKVTISDMSGRLVASPSLTQEGNDTYRINQQLKAGVYMIQMSNGKESKTSKLIIK
ncbi:hypothetical protein HNP38_002984 [Chryseobacterium defluvii]|uniref:Secreted protein (Por secretion system target) n=1 Tax=Chryseobacterium defluvii TaxID=160396 RepID=A0A840KI29_9FLAO|nr:GEVED domain-containing protein [Chryseobacterium defluvii]MBB4807678.1 hypothetical protein [Chryseobacterium defluvii]